MINSKQLNYLTKFFSFLSILFIFCACKKDSADNTPKTKTQLLIAHTWKYDEYFRNYNNTSTTLYYKRGKSNNLLNLDQNRVTFRADGTYTEITETGTTINGTWQFLNNETQTKTTYSGGTNTATIILLNDTQFVWYDPTTSSGTYGEMIPQ